MKYKDQEVIAGGIKDYNNITFSWSLIDVCQFKCEYCYEGFGNPEHPVHSSNFLKDNKRLNVWNDVLARIEMLSHVHESFPITVHLLGGEPTLHPDIYIIIKKLCSIKNLQRVSLITNLAKSFSFFSQFNSKEFEKLYIHASIHFQYFKPEALSKCVQLYRLDHINIKPCLILHDDEKYWPRMLTCFQTCIDEGVDYTCLWLFSAHGYVPSLNNKFYEVFQQYIDNASEGTPAYPRGDPEWSFTTNKGKITLNQREVRQNNLNKFKGWSCRALHYNIEFNGDFTHSCTEEKFPLEATSVTILSDARSRVDKAIMCPCDECFIHLWDHERIKP
jgi:organic radical activating enzyme